jgi:hypothetical protein
LAGSALYLISGVGDDGSAARCRQNYGGPARLWQWNIGIQRQVTKDLAVEASYVGNRGVWWRTASLGDYNKLTPQGLLKNYGLDWNSPADRTILARN